MSDNVEHIENALRSKHFTTDKRASLKAEKRSRIQVLRLSSWKRAAFEPNLQANFKTNFTTWDWKR